MFPSHRRLYCMWGNLWIHFKFVMDFSGNILTFDFEFICEYCGAATDNKNWMNKFKFEHWIEIKLQLSSQFRLCHLPSSKDFNENKTVARKDELGPGSKSCRWVKCLSGTSLMEKLVIISLIKQRSVSWLALHLDGSVLAHFTVS